MGSTQPTDPPIFDGHNDTVLRMAETGRSFFDRADDGHLDLPRARAGGLGGGLFAIYVNDPVTPDGERAGGMMSLEYAQSTALNLLGRLLKVPGESHGQVRIAHTAADLTEYLDNGIFAMVLHLEGAEPLDREGYALDTLYAAGVRSVGLTHSRPNQFATGVPRRMFPGTPDIGPGLTGAGERLVRQLNHRRVMINLSHINEQGFWDVSKITAAPLVASHSNVHTLCPSPRNLTDKQLDAIGKSGGLVGLNFAVSFLRADGERNPDVSIARMIEHIDYMAERIGIDHVGLGSDFDGTLIPAEIGHAAGLPKLVSEMHDRGYSSDDLHKLLQGNWLRVLRETWGG